jgi:hypothetical protein
MYPYPDVQKSLEESQLARDLARTWDEVENHYTAGDIFGAIKALGPIGAEILGMLTLVGGIFVVYRLISARSASPYVYQPPNVLLQQHFLRLAPQLVASYANLASSDRQKVIKLLRLIGIKPTSLWKH